MLKEVVVDNKIELENIQNTFSEVFKQKNELTDTFSSNPYVKLYTYSVDKKIVAFIQYEDIYDRFELDNIYVLKEYRNRGIASSLMEFMINEGKKKEIINITLEVREDNVNAINLYKKYGFTEKAIRNNYYDNCNGILMEKEMM